MSAAAETQGGDDLLPGFRDPVHGAQRTFRMLLQAMARPGRPQRCAEELTAPPPLQPAMTALCLTLADADTPLWLSPRLAGGAAVRYLRFHCGAPMLDAPRAATFALADAGEAPPLGELAAGEDRYPDRSATLVIEVPGFEAGGERGWTLRGPGIERTARLAVDGLPADFSTQWRRNGGLFPQGVDVILTCGTRLVALPRTTAVEG
mgnify:CR=1 FL=1